MSSYVAWFERSEPAAQLGRVSKQARETLRCWPRSARVVIKKVGARWHYCFATEVFARSISAAWL